MNTQMRRGLIAIGLLVGGVLPLEPAHSTINPITVVAGSPTISITDPVTGADIDTSNNRWLPEPDQTVRLVVNGLVNPTITLDAANTTSHPGICTNYGTDSGLDFSLTGNLLTAKDCAGIARVLVNGIAFNLPADANNNRIADVWEVSRGGNVIANQDLDLSPSTSDATQPTSDPNCLGDCRKGDGIAAIDEYRGFIVSMADKTAGVPFAALLGTKHIRTEPSQKDIFVHLVNNQCVPAAPPAILGKFARYFTQANGKDLFEFAYTTFPGSIHLLDFTPYVDNPVRSVLWEDFFDKYTVSDPDGAGPLISKVQFLTAGGVPTNLETDVPADRQINKNAVIPIVDLKTGSTRQKGIRLIECQDTTMTGALGISDWGTPNKAGSIYAGYSGNTTVFTNRIRIDIAGQLALRGNRQIRYSIYNPSTAQWVLQAGALAPGQDTEDFLTARDLQYLIGHELAHVLQLRPTSANGYHTLTDSGSMMDQTIKVTVEGSGAGTAAKKITFDIPSVFLSSDQIEIKTKN